ncbi:MAG: glycoside hydrolase family 16 protein [Aeromicrobium sp.]
MPTRRTTRAGIVVAVTGLLLGCLVVAGSTASAAAAHVTVKVIGKVAVGPGERARVTPRYSIRKGVTIRSAKISVRRGSTWVARGARSARLPAGTYRVTSRVSYRVRGTSGLGHVRTAKRTQTLRVVTVRAPVVRAADASPPVMPPAAVPPAPEASSLSTTGAACDAGSLRKPDGSPWVCSFSDEFSGTALDRGTWTPQLTAASGYHIGADCYVDDPENIAVGGGVLALTVRQQAGEFACTTPGGSRPAQATAGMVSTYDSFAQAHGRFEIRAAFPETTVAGHHGALWLFGKDMSGVEIDIAELYSNYADRVIPYVHYASGADTTVTNPYCLVNRPSDFHTYTLEWTATAMSIAYDGTVCLTHRINGESPGASSPFDAPFMLVLTQGLGLGENAATASTPAVGTTRIDYVRVWR